MMSRPMLILNGKPRRYDWLAVSTDFVDRLKVYDTEVAVDSETYYRPKISYSTRRSGRRMIYVDVPEVE